MKAEIIICVLALVGCHIQARADLYDDIVAQVEANNPQLKALRYDNISELAELRSGNTLPETELEFEHVWSVKGSERKWNAGIAQSFDFPGAYRARSREIAARRDAFEMRYRAELTDVALRARELLIEVAYLNKAISLETAVVDDMKSIADMLSRSYDGGEATVLEVNRSKIESANNIIKLRELTERRNACVAELKTLGYSLDDAADVMYPLAVLESVDTYYSQVDSDASVAYYRQLKQAEVMGVKARRMEMLPGLKVGYIHEYEEGTHFNGFSVGLTLPFLSGRAGKVSAIAAAGSAQWEETAARVERRSLIDVEYRSAVSNKELLDMLGPVFSTGNHIELLAKAYRGGQMSAIDYLREVTYFRESEWNYLEIELSYHLSLARLNKFQILLNSTVL